MTETVHAAHPSGDEKVTVHTPTFTTQVSADQFEEAMKNGSEKNEGQHLRPLPTHTGNRPPDGQDALIHQTSYVEAMPNWCTTSYALTGGRKEVRSLYRKMKRLQERKTPLVPNGFGLNWLGCLVKSLGADPEKVYCRGQWSNLKFSDEGVLTFDTEHAWSRPAEVEMLIEKTFPSVSIWFLEEELGMDIFQTNDESKQFFPQQVIIDEESEGMEYYTEEEAFKRLSQLTGMTVSTWEEANHFLSALNEAQDAAGGEGHIWVHIADIV